jgi:predicted transposase/invertase (TIGR01784 family)
MLEQRMIVTPHDAMFKAVFGQPEHARGTLRAIVPPLLAESLDWATLTLRPGSFVDTTLSHEHTDLLYSVSWRSGGEALVHLLFEHQSSPPTDGLMAHRLLRYQIRIWERRRADHPKARTLPVIVPIDVLRAPHGMEVLALVSVLSSICTRMSPGHHMPLLVRARDYLNII